MAVGATARRGHDGEGVKHDTTEEELGGAKEGQLGKLWELAAMLYMEKRNCWRKRNFFLRQLEKS